MKRILLNVLSLSACYMIFLPPVSFCQATEAVVANNEFACSLYAQYKSKEDNIVYSPYSITSVIAMTYEGANGKTAKEIRDVFHFPENTSILRESFLNVNQEINKSNNELHMTNSLWTQKNYNLLPSYLSTAENYYGGKVTSLDFIGATEESRLKINSFVSEQTNNKIIDLIPPGGIDENTRLVLTNAIYFKADWSTKFPINATEIKYFMVNPTDKIKTHMMHLYNEIFKYGETDSLQILEIPYKENELSMLILLPKKYDLTGLEKMLSAQKLSEWRGLLQYINVDLYLPRFKLENKHFMATELKKMGMTTAFSFRDADFSGIAGVTDKDDPFYITDVIHQAFVGITEEGTEAAAATAEDIASSCLPLHRPDTILFEANHPFIFIIQDRETGIILFMGRVSKPTIAISPDAPDEPIIHDEL